MGGRRLYLFILFIVFEFSCAASTTVSPVPGSESIKVLEAVDPAEKLSYRFEKERGCRLLLKKIIIPPSAKKQIYSAPIWDKEIEIIGRNTAVNSGGNVLILEKFRPIPEIKPDVKYTGKIIIMKCP
ncbi:hypothetical protein [Persephonella sp.]|uniref:hypothetical protein n=1 Tax=Persephonella sp. TaxID=2060922 RepID=UPI0025ECC439|nr:hypothetical protein [Persephonella sp.]